MRGARVAIAEAQMTLPASIGLLEEVVPAMMGGAVAVGADAAALVTVGAAAFVEGGAAAMGGTEAPSSSRQDSEGLFREGLATTVAAARGASQLWRLGAAREASRFWRLRARLLRATGAAAAACPVGLSNRSPQLGAADELPAAAPVQR